ncbi:MAG: gamma-glutamylcyclotransferase family protein [Synechococcus sp.]
MATSFEQIFVYGSLKSGCSAHHLLAGAERQADGCLEGVKLTSSEGYPMLWRGDQTINGEVYRVDPALMPQLDSYEGVPNDYIRLQHLLRDGRRVWVYMHPSAGL